LSFIEGSYLFRKIEGSVLTEAITTLSTVITTTTTNYPNA
jgi:hypothetical protein